MITVYDFINLFIDGVKIALYDFTSETEVFRGWSQDIPDEYEDLEVLSLDPPTMDDDHMIINIETEED